jgi:hypothetical protein
VIDSPTTYHSTIRARMAMIRAARVGLSGRNESIPVRTERAPPYAFMPMVAARASADRKATTLPRPSNTLFPAVWRPCRPSTAPSRIASHAPSTISQKAAPAAPKKTEAMTDRAGVFAGRYRE